MKHSLLAGIINLFGGSRKEETTSCGSMNFAELELDDLLISETCIHGLEDMKRKAAKAPYGYEPTIYPNSARRVRLINLLRSYGFRVFVPGGGEAEGVVVPNPPNPVANQA